MNIINAPTPHSTTPWTKKAWKLPTLAYTQGALRAPSPLTYRILHYIPHHTTRLHTAYTLYYIVYNIDYILYTVYCILYLYFCTILHYYILPYYNSYTPIVPRHYTTILFLTLLYYCSILLGRALQSHTALCVVLCSALLYYATVSSWRPFPVQAASRCPQMHRCAWTSSSPPSQRTHMVPMAPLSSPLQYGS